MPNLAPFMRELELQTPQEASEDTRANTPKNPSQIQRLVQGVLLLIATTMGTGCVTYNKAQADSLLDQLFTPPTPTVSANDQQNIISDTDEEVVTAPMLPGIWTLQELYNRLSNYFIRAEAYANNFSDNELSYTQEALVSHVEFLQVTNEIQNMLDQLNRYYELLDQTTGQPESRGVITQNRGANEQRWVSIRQRVQFVITRYQEYKKLYESLHSLLCRTLPHRNQNRIRQVFYRLLTQELRNKYAYWQFVMGWSLMDEKVDVLMGNIRDITITHVSTQPDKAIIIFTCEQCQVENGSITLTRVQNPQNNRSPIPDQWEIAGFRVKFTNDNEIHFP